MKIAIHITIDVDPAEWDLIYGNGSRPDEVREGVRQYVGNLVQESPGMTESGAIVSIR
jgi:hypothetical protein